MAEEIKKPEENMTSIPEADVSKVKVRHILAQRIKKCGAKKIIAVVLMAIVCFGGGIMTDRLILKHGYGRNLSGRPGFQSKMRGNSFGNRNSKLKNKGNKSSSQNQNQNQQPTQ